MKDLTLNFDVSEKSIIESAEIVKEFVSFLEEMKMYYYFPFSQNASTEDIKAQIKKDSVTFKIVEAEKNIKESWSKYAHSIIPKLSTLANGAHLGRYRCALTFYGPYGYYYTPDTIYVNITKGTPDEWIETLLHELLHLIFSEKIESMEHLEEERFIDSTFVDLFGDIFPNYKVQNI
jgi:hypothetical protein